MSGKADHLPDPDWGKADRTEDGDQEDLEVVIARLRERYKETEDPKCRVCGSEMRMGMAGQGRIEWFCKSDEASSIGKKGKASEDATHHYWASQEIQTQFVDGDVIRVLDALEEGM